MANIVIVTNGNFFARVILDKLFDDQRRQIRGVVIVQGDYHGNTGLAALRKLSRSTTFFYLAYKLFMFGFFKLAQLWSSRAWGVEDVVKQLDLPYLVTPRVNTPEVVEFVCRARPNLMVSVSCPQRIRKSLLEIPTCGSINIHSSLLPSFAGLAPYFWALANGASITGTTIHYMNEVFDEGNILVQKELGIPARTSAFSLFHQLAMLGRDLMPQAVALALTGHKGAEQDATETTYFSHPDRDAYLRLRRRGHRLIHFADIIRVLVGGDFQTDELPSDQSTSQRAA